METKKKQNKTYKHIPDMFISPRINNESMCLSWRSQECSLYTENTDSLQPESFPWDSQYFVFSTQKACFSVIIFLVVSSYDSLAGSQERSTTCKFSVWEKVIRAQMSHGFWHPMWKKLQTAKPGAPVWLLKIKKKQTEKKNSLITKRMKKKHHDCSGQFSTWWLTAEKQ